MTNARKMVQNDVEVAVPLARVPGSIAKAGTDNCDNCVSLAVTDETCAWSSVICVCAAACRSSAAEASPEGAKWP